mgnify:CR=1 FL=1
MSVQAINAYLKNETIEQWDIEPCTEIRLNDEKIKFDTDDNGFLDTLKNRDAFNVLEKCHLKIPRSTFFISGKIRLTSVSRDPGRRVISLVSEARLISHSARSSALDFDGLRSSISG